MARANVRISTAKVLDLLRAKAKETAKQLAELPALQKKHTAEVEAWEKKVIASIPKTAKPASVEVRTHTWGEHNGKTVVTLTYALPQRKFGEKPEERLTNAYTLRNQLEELEKTIKLMELTEDDTVSTSVYKNLADLL